ncbi:MAG: imidazole glycerol phosphate synthase subunit HisH [Candidatus Handelsmanbacteria bacterium]|nr:imidazole glycerol phosphate synthase subunit HisH [Candidatus Handelsmanbacteria bacterium]
MIAVVDYGMGNLRSVQKAFEHLGFAAAICEDPAQLEAASHLVLPGDAAFGDAMRNLRERGWVEALLRGIARGKPFLGICVGLQLMYAESEELGTHPGLGLLPGKVRRFPPAERVPQIGWNQVAITRQVSILDGVKDLSFFYFVHSYYVDAERQADVAGTTDYGLEYTSVAARDHLFGVQFHPEKSQQPGLRLLENFARLN